MEIQRKSQDVKKQKGDITKNNHLNDNDIFKMIEILKKIIVWEMLRWKYMY